jgi:hypothetical protein
MSGSNSNLSTINGQQVTAAAKRKEDDAAAVAQAATCIESRRPSSLSWLLHARPWTRHWHASALLPLLGRRRRPSLVTWTTSRRYQGIALPQDDDDDRSIDTGSNPNTTLTADMHA